MSAPSSSRLTLVMSVGLVAVSLSAIFIRLADAPGVVVAAYRMLLASLILLPWTIRALKATPLTRKNAGYATLAGLLLGAHFATWISSLSYTSVAASTSLGTTTPVWVALSSWTFLGLAPSFTALLGMLVAILGGALIGFGGAAGGSSSAPLLGNTLALFGAVAAAAYLLLGRAAQNRGLSLQAYVGVAYGVAAISLLPLPFFLGYSYSGYSPASYFWILLLALLPQLVGHTAYNYAVKHMDPTGVATVILLEPIGASLLALLVFSEVPPLLTLLGALILLVGVAITTRNSRALPSEEAA
jgi:drug/metabolite transporter (DMT)-like permease